MRQLQLQVESAVLEYQRVTVRDLKEKFQMPKSSFHRVINDPG